MKRLIISILVGIIAAVVFAQVYSIYLQPEINFYKKAINISSQYEQKLRAQGHNCCIIGGGSEIRSSIRPEIMFKDCGVPAVNVATAAPFGVAANLAIALNHAHPGDTLLLSLVSTSSSGFKATSNGTKLTYQLYGSKAFSSCILPFNFESVQQLLSHDSASMLISIVRYFTRGYSYIYSVQSTIHPDGWMEIQRGGMKNKKISRHVQPYHPLSPECKSALIQAQDKCQQQGINFAIMLPPSYVHPDYSIHYLLNALHISRLGIPVLKDERLGIIKDCNLLSDTISHLNKQGSIENSRIIARAIKENQYWNEDELVNRLLLHGIRVAPAQQDYIMP